MSAKKPLPFNLESAMQELNQLIEKLEQGGDSLEASLTYFEKGISLTRQCQKALMDAEQKVQILMEKNGQIELAPYQDDED